MLFFLTFATRCPLSFVFVDRVLTKIWFQQTWVGGRDVCWVCLIVLSIQFDCKQAFPMSLSEDRRRVNSLSMLHYEAINPNVNTQGHVYPAWCIWASPCQEYAAMYDCNETGSWPCVHVLRWHKSALRWIKSRRHKRWQTTACMLWTIFSY